MAVSNPTGDVARNIAIASARGWRPAPGDNVTGTIVKLDMLDSGAYGPYPAVTIETNDGKFVVIHAFHTLLWDGLAGLDVKSGDTITVAYVGRIMFGETVVGKKGEETYIPDPSKADYEHYVVLPGDGTAVPSSGPIDWASNGPKHRGKSE
jgi:hypothetical protein